MKKLDKVLCKKQINSSIIRRPSRFLYLICKKDECYNINKITNDLMGESFIWIECEDKNIKMICLDINQYKEHFYSIQELRKIKIIKWKKLDVIITLFLN